MRTNILYLGLVFASLSLAGCGTIVNGGSQTVDVVVKGSPSAFCDFSTSTARNTGTFPNKVTLERSRETLIAECRGEQNLYKKFKIEPIAQTREAAGGNVANGTTVFGLSYDMLSGGAWGYPDPLIVDFRVPEVAPKVGWPEKTVDGEPAAIEKPTPVHMQPVMDDQLNPAIGTRATGKPKIIDAVSLANDKGAVAPTKKAAMKPVVSPEDTMGADPAKIKAKEAAKAKAKADAKRKAAAAAAAKKKAAAKAAEKAKAEEAEAKPAETLPQVEEAAPAEATQPEAPTTAPEPEAAPAETAPKAEENAAPKAQENAVPAATKPQENAVPAVKTEGQSVDVDKYLTGDGQ